MSVRITIGCLALLVVAFGASNVRANDDVMAIADGDKDGKLSDDEARKGVDGVLAEANAKEKADRGKRLLSAFDKNKDNKLDETEATAAVADTRRGTAQGKRMDEVFAGLDENKDGAVDKREFEKLPDKLGGGGRWLRKRTGEMFKDFDKNNDSKITPVEAQMSAGVLGPRFGGRGGPGFGGPGSEPAAPMADPLRDGVDKLVTALDRDKDRKLSEKEYKSNKDIRVRAKQMDLDLDEELTADEIYTFYKAHPPEKK